MGLVFRMVSRIVRAVERALCICVCAIGRLGYAFGLKRREHVTFEELKERAGRVQTRGAVEKDLLQFVTIAISWIERIRRSAAAGRELHIRKSVRGDKQKIEAADLVGRLLPTACWMLHGLDVDPSPDGGGSKTQSGPKFEYPPPGPLVEKLESTEAGCRCLFEKWASIHKRLARRRDWLVEDVFTILRLMGRRPLDALEDPEVAVVFMAADACNRGRDNAFMELKKEIGFARAKDFMKRASELAATRLDLESAEQGRTTIIGIMDDAMNRLSAKAEEHRLRASSDLAREAAGREFDSSPVAAELNRQEKQWIVTGRNCLNRLLKFQRYSADGTSESERGAVETGKRAAANGRKFTEREQRNVS